MATHRPTCKHRRCLRNSLKSWQRRKCRDFCTHWVRKRLAVIYTLVVRLTKVQVKTIGDNVTTMETEALVETLSDSVNEM